MAQLAVYGRDGAELGTLDGFLIEPGTGRFSHLVVKRDFSGGARRSVIPVDSLIYLTCDAGSARLEVDADALVTSDLDLDSIPPMGERGSLRLTPRDQSDAFNSPAVREPGVASAAIG
jgi:hypothetical protein